MWFPNCTYLFVVLLISHLCCHTSGAESDQVTTLSLRGEIIDKQSRSPLAGVTVHIVGLEKSTHTDPSGQFSAGTFLETFDNFNLKDSKVWTIFVE